MATPFNQKEEEEETKGAPLKEVVENVDVYEESESGSENAE